MAPEASPGDQLETEDRPRQPVNHDRINQLADKFHRKLLTPEEARELKLLIEVSDEAMAVYRRRMSIYREQERMELELTYAAAADSEVEVANMRTEVMEALESQATAVLEEVPEDFISDVPPARKFSENSDFPVDHEVHEFHKAHEAPHRSGHFNSPVTGPQGPRHPRQRNSLSGLRAEEITGPLRKKSVRRKNDRTVLHIALLFLVLFIAASGFSAYLYFELTSPRQVAKSYYQVLDSKNEQWPMDAYLDIKNGRLQTGKLYRLLQGEVAIKHVDGTELRFFGHSEFILRANAVFLSRGQMIARVSDTDQGDTAAESSPENGFIIESRFGKVAGLGEFGLHITPTTRGRLFVREGLAETATPGRSDEGEDASIMMYETLPRLMILRWEEITGIHKIQMSKSLLLEKRFEVSWQHTFKYKPKTQPASKPLKPEDGSPSAKPKESPKKKSSKNALKSGAVSKISRSDSHGESQGDSQIPIKHSSSLNVSPVPESSQEKWQLPSTPESKDGSDLQKLKKVLRRIRKSLKEKEAAESEPVP